MLGIVRLTRRQVVDLLFEQNIFCPLPAATEVHIREMGHEKLASL